MEQYHNLINGEWVQGSNVLANINPSDVRDEIGTISLADEAMVNEAVEAAHEAQKTWGAKGIEARSEALTKIGNALIDQKQLLGELLAREEGKTIAEGVGEVDRAGKFFHYYAAEALRQIGDFADSVRPGVEIEVIREPVGVVLAITPWNFPMALPAWKIAPALAFGNSVILKPANLTPGCAVALAKIIEQAGVPKGVFQLILGQGKTVGQTLLDHNGIHAVTFTGSLATGRTVAACSAAQLKRYQLEMGSKNALIILDDANIDNAVACAVNGAFSSTGQKCTASSRIIVTKGVHDQFVEKFIQQSRTLKVGHALAKDTNIGPCVSETQLKTNQRYRQMALDEGAQMAFEGAVNVDTEGHYFAPIIFTGTHNEMQVNREEIFGPITCLQQVDDYETALGLCNDTDFGLTAGIVTDSLKYATHFKRHAQSGCIMVNLPTAGTDYHVPFGGTKLSSSGPREQGQYAIEFYTKIKTAYIKAGA